MTLPETKMGAVHKHQIIEKAIKDLIEKNILKEKIKQGKVIKGRIFRFIKR